MIVSWNWLKTLVELDMPPEELERRLMMAGLNHESSERVGDDLAIDLEVTSNRPDCLGHIGIAREISVLWRRELKIPEARIVEGKTPVTDLVGIKVESPALCPRYMGRVVRNVRVGPSPPWLADRLQTIGIATINNVVDVTNYVLMECGQPLHAFDVAHLNGRQVIVRPARSGETIEAIDHRTYALDPKMCVIADRDRAVGIAGIMGGAGSEVSQQTRDILIESAVFDPSAIRSAARKLNLHSDSSYRFERGLDPSGVDWASRRACELIVQTAGGEIAASVIDVGAPASQPKPIVLRFAQLKRILGIEVPEAEVFEILRRLGCQRSKSSDEKTSAMFVPPTWRRDLEREIDLVEEVARIYGYDKIPEDVSVPMATSSRTADDRVLERVRNGLTAAGFDEALTISVVEDDWSRAFSPWTDAEPLKLSMPILRRADCLRRSLVPSLLGARRTNESLANPEIELFEIARAYLPRRGQLPCEELLLAMTSSRDFSTVKGLIEALVAQVNPAIELQAAAAEFDLLDVRQACRLTFDDGEVFGLLGSVSAEGLRQFDLRSPTMVAELRLEALIARAVLVPQYVRQSPFPAISRDLNLVVDEPVRWESIARAVRGAGGELLESFDYRDTYRDPERLGAGKKSVLLSVRFRDQQGTLTSEQADTLRDAIVAACREAVGAELRA
ncbi:MAG TPA: phenylalanine--tRNA ligase subunit beta [Pirellulales bacterium]|nr:phenylalanine--tRNA ligase subunit beta [Pirellulales bacterium]